MQTQEIILKLGAVADTNKTFGSDEEEQYYTMATSDITDTPKKKALHERMISFPGIHSLFSGIDFLSSTSYRLPAQPLDRDLAFATYQRMLRNYLSKLLLLIS